MEISRIMFALLRSEMQETGLGEDVKNLIMPEGLPALFTLAKKHDLAHLVGDALDKNGLLPDGSDIKKRFLHERNMSVYRCEQQRYEFEQICAALERAQISFLPLKGSILRGYYPEPWMRTSCDIDILVQAHMLDGAAQVLCDGLDYTRAEKPSINELSLHSPSGVHLELHYDLTEGEKYGKDVLSKIWAYTQPTDGKQHQMQLSDGAFYFYHIVHMVKHFEFGGCGVRPFLDLWLLNHRTEFDKRSAETLLQQSGFLTFAKACENLSETWFNNAPCDEIGQKMEEYILAGGVYGNLENCVSMQQARKGSKIRYLLSRIFISNKELKIKYPILQKRPFLIPFYHVKRWLKPLTNKKTGKKSLQELTCVSAMPQDEWQMWEGLLQRLGLKD